MLIILIISTIIVGLCIVLHFHQHFRSCIINEEFDFFPVSFLLYMIFMFIICGLITLKYMYTETTSFIPYFYYNDEFMGKAPYPFLNDTFTKTSNLRVSSSIDIFIYCSIIIAMVWESLFSFYRYYTTIISAKYFYSPKFSTVMKRFSIYMVVFVLLFVVQTQLYYWLFPLVFLCHFVMNIYCISKVAHILVASFRQLSNRVKTNSAFVNFQKDLIRGVKTMCYLSLTSCILSSLYILSFVATYNMQITYYFPVIWCLSVSCYLFNFVRNQHFIKDKLCVSKSTNNTNNVQTRNRQCMQRNPHQNGNQGVNLALELPTYSPKADKFVVYVENVDTENKVNTPETPLIKIETFTSKSVSYISQKHVDGQRNSFKLPIFTNNGNTNDKKSRSTGNLMSFATKKRVNKSNSDNRIHELPLIDTQCIDDKVANSDASNTNEVRASMKKMNEYNMAPIDEYHIATSPNMDVIERADKSRKTRSHSVKLSNKNKNVNSNTPQSADQASNYKLNLPVNAVDSQSIPMYKLNLPVSNTDINIRSSSNPLLLSKDEKDKINQLNELITIPSLQPQHQQQSLSSPKLSLENMVSYPSLDVAVGESRRFTYSSDNMSPHSLTQSCQIKTFTLLDAVQQVHAHKDNKLNIRKSESSLDVARGHSSAVTMFNLFVSQGFYDTKRAHSATNSHEMDNARHLHLDQIRCAKLNVPAKAKNSGFSLW